MKFLHVTCSTLKLVIYGWDMKMALQNFVLFVNILFMHLERSNSELTVWIHVVQLQKFHKRVCVAKDKCDNIKKYSKKLFSWFAHGNADWKVLNQAFKISALIKPKNDDIGY